MSTTTTQTRTTRPAVNGNGSDPVLPAKRPARKTPAKLRADQARALVDAQTRYDKAKRELEEAKTQRDQLLARLLPKFEIGRWLTVAGWAMRVTLQRPGDRFRLAEYLKAGHKITSSMRDFVTSGEERPRLWIKPGG